MLRNECKVMNEKTGICKKCNHHADNHRSSNKKWVIKKSKKMIIYDKLKKKWDEG